MERAVEKTDERRGAGGAQHFLMEREKEDSILLAAKANVKALLRACATWSEAVEYAAPRA